MIIALLVITGTVLTVFVFALLRAGAMADEAMRRHHE